ncbi:MAG: M20/M25/M40 family metallo-hydrolase, partial [Gemmatimonadaceae bacterium]
MQRTNALLSAIAFKSFVLVSFFGVALVTPVSSTSAQGVENASKKTPSAHDSLARAILAELLSINTAPSGGEMSRATKAMAKRLIAAGFPVTDVVLAGPDAKHQNLVARLRGRDVSAKPILLMAHVDVVEALASDWSMNPFVLNEKDGYFYGRGSTDNKGGAAVLVANMVRWKREKFVPTRDLIMVLTTDEETSAVDGIQWLLKHRPELAKAEYALNTDAGGLHERDGGRTALYVESAEKMYQTYLLTVTNRGGHSSSPRADNAIYELASALSRLEKYDFPVMLSEVTRTSFTRSAELETGALASAMLAVGSGDTSAKYIDVLTREPSMNGNLRTTCVATMLAGGHAENALPQSAIATVNCRIFPGVSAAEVQDTLERVVNDTSVHVST